MVTFSDSEQPAKATGYRETSITSLLSNCAPTVDSFIQWLMSFGFGRDDLIAVRHGLHEAVVNAVRHGNHSNPTLEVRVSCHVQGAEIRLDVEDQGPGFSLVDVPDPTAFSNLERPCGRGLMMMRHFMTTVEFNERGNAVTMCRICEVQQVA